MSYEYTRDFLELLQKERALIDTQRHNRGGGKRRGHVGLALSGGGIRSAAFSLGVLQALHGTGLFRFVDYLSTVSGGGYIGTSLTWFLRNGETDFPLGEKSTGARNPHGDGDYANARLDLIRQHGNYLDPSTGFNRASFGPDEGGANEAASHCGGVNLISLAAVVLRSTLLSVFVYGTLLVTLFFALASLDAAIGPVRAFLESAAPWPLLRGALDRANFASLAASLLMIWLLLVYLRFALGTFFHDPQWRDDPKAAQQNSSRYRARLRLQRRAGKLLIWIGTLLVLGLTPVVSRSVYDALHSAFGGGLTAGGGVLLALVLTTIAYRAEQAPLGENPSRARRRLQLLLLVAGSILVLSVLVLTHTIAVGIADGGWVGAIGVLLLVALLIGLLSNLNCVGLNRVYRDRLMETFMPGDVGVEHGQWRPAVEADRTALHRVCGAKTVGPYQLLNANVITPDSPFSRFRSRGGDSFLLSPLYCGSDATGWVPTHAWMGGRMTLATAMSISGAAVNPGAAVNGQGATRGWLTSLVLALLGLRLGYWAHNPDSRFPSPAPDLPPSFIYPGLAQGLFSRRLSEQRPYVELTDGGHFDNLGMYELVRRRVDTIIAIDGSADQQYGFGSLANTVEKVRVDFGTNIRFEDDDFGLDGLLPGSAADAALADKYPLSRRGIAVAVVEYPDAPPGLLVYLKATLIPGLPADVLGYRSAHSAFPDQPTSDQLFDEAQFEAYRELGYQLAQSGLQQFPALKERLEGTQR